MAVTSQTFYEVMFDDGSFSRDTFPEDIVVSTFPWVFAAQYTGESKQLTLWKCFLDFLSSLYPWIVMVFITLNSILINLDDFPKLF
jgi:hypothetical protein